MNLHRDEWTVDVQGQNIYVLFGPGDETGPRFLTGRQVRVITEQLQLACQLADLNAYSASSRGNREGGAAPPAPWWPTPQHHERTDAWSQSSGTQATAASHAAASGRDRLGYEIRDCRYLADGRPRFEAWVPDLPWPVVVAEEDEGKWRLNVEREILLLVGLRPGLGLGGLDVLDAETAVEWLELIAGLFSQASSTVGYEAGDNDAS